jgi:CRP/FNR family transcriptional regulator, nitrogen fixation regulation protein
MHPTLSLRSTDHVASALRNRQPNFALLSEVPELAGAVMPFERNAEIYGEGEPAEYVYKVISGAVRAYRVLSDGRRQVIGFYLPGDVFGLDLGGKHSVSTEAVASTKVLFVRQSALLAVAQHDAGLTREIFEVVSSEIRRAHDHTLVLIRNAQERVAGFLLEMARRLPRGEAVELPMSRQDIADYLGLTIETVSRTISQFEDSGKISLITSRRITLNNRSALNQLNS